MNNNVFPVFIHIKQAILGKCIFNVSGKGCQTICFQPSIHSCYHQAQLNSNSKNYLFSVINVNNFIKRKVVSGGSKYFYIFHDKLDVY